MREVAVIGVGHTKFGRHPNKSLMDLWGEAAMEAIKESGVDKEEIDALFIGQFVGELTDGMANIGPLAASEIGISYIPTIRIEGACASSAVALRDAYMWVASGYYDLVLVGGMERLSPAGTEIATRALATAVDGVYEFDVGLTFPGVFAMAARLYSSKYGIPLEELREKMAHVSIKNHRYGAKNPLAQFYQKMGNLTPENVMNARMIAAPLTLLDCCSMPDGASACVLAEARLAEKLVKKPIYVLSAAQSSAAPMYRQKEVIGQARVKSSQAAYNQAGIAPQDVDVVELHDCFTIAEIMATEAMGFFDWGEGADAVVEGKTEIGGKIPVNPSGGLIGKGHPVGATGTAQVYSIVKQLRGEMKDTRVRAEVGMTDTLGGGFGTVCNIILSTRRREEWES